MSPAEIFAALGDPTRLSLIARLGDGNGRSIVQLGEGLPISRQAVAKHLEVLHGAGLVRRHKQGREVHFALRREAVAAAQDWLGRVGAQWDGTLARLKAFAEGDDQTPPAP
ncbi:ArsR/SmtB family transcription factor [Sphingobium yanoikuyae]|jgi:DNA-binding transcriptional ArsR family regulator|uniref:ArsR/SmtB family transcription factor n=1 Tax=Sphingobium yanoikuyae TaxID=13690 RepID=UPI0024201CE0|nr:metalloregulator ArsR/SmtB family transcription factor [Sphingobium yanoikuyae]